jgi:hypothetical protein
MTSTATHVRITNGGTPEFITAREALDEVNAAMMGNKRAVRTMSTDQGGRAASIEYRDGRKVTIRPATEGDQPAPTAEEVRVMSVRGGEVHKATVLEIAGGRGEVVYPQCRTMAQNSRGTRWVRSKSPVTCSKCKG